MSVEGVMLSDLVVAAMEEMEVGTPLEMLPPSWPPLEGLPGMRYPLAGGVPSVCEVEA